MKNGILLVGYGTRKGNLEEILEEQASRLRASTAYDVGIGYFRVSKPSIPEAMERMAADGTERVVVVPYYVAEGTLTYDLIPEKIGLHKRMRDGTAEFSGRKIRVHIADAFNFSPAVTDIICDRIRESGGTRDSGILIIGHGTRDPSMMNYAAVERNAERLKERGYRHVRFAFNEFCAPAIRDSLAELVSEGAEDIVCVPLFIAMGLHLGEEIPEQIGIPAYSSGSTADIGGRNITVSYTRPLEDDPRLAELIMSRISAYLSG